MLGLAVEDLDRLVARQAGFDLFFDLLWVVFFWHGDWSVFGAGALHLGEELCAFSGIGDGTEAVFVGLVRESLLPEVHQFLQARAPFAFSLDRFCVLAGEAV